MDCVEFNHSNATTKRLRIRTQLDGSNGDRLFLLYVIRSKQAIFIFLLKCVSHIIYFSNLLFEIVEVAGQGTAVHFRMLPLCGGRS